jgi:uncharacterized OB-fold protein
MTQAATYTKPLPQPGPITAPFWQASREHRLSIQRCAACKAYIFYPRAMCPHCGAADLAWADVRGRGTVYSYTVARRATMRPFESDVPYVIAIVELEEGPRMTTNIVGCPPESVRVGMPVEAVFDDVTPEVTLVKFGPAS